MQNFKWYLRKPHLLNFCHLKECQKRNKTSNIRNSILFSLFFFLRDSLPNFDKISCCSSRVEKRILGFSPFIFMLSHGGCSQLGLSLGSTSTSRFTWNKSGYFSCMSQASRSYLQRHRSIDSWYWHTTRLIHYSPWENFKATSIKLKTCCICLLFSI